MQVPVLVHLIHFAISRLSFDLFLDLLLVVTQLTLRFLCGGKDEEVGNELVIAGEYVGGDVCNLLHVLVVAFVHGTGESDADEFFCEAGMLLAEGDEGLHVLFDLCVEVVDGEDFFEAEVVPLKCLYQSEIL